jgi:uncharacterized protein
MIRAVVRGVGRAVGTLAGGYLLYVGFRGSGLLVRPDVRPFVPEFTGAPSTPSDIGLPYEDVRFTTDDGATLSGWYVPSARATRTGVAVLHGFMGHRLAHLPGVVPWLHEQHNLLLFDFRGHGESDHRQVTLGAHERRDVAAAIRFMEGRGLGPLALFGVSMGASTAIVAAPQLPVAAVVADAPFAHLHHPVANRMRQVGYPLAGVGARFIVAGAALRTRSWLGDPIRAARRLGPRALMVIVPREDRLISWRQGEALYRAASEPKELWVVDGAGHGEAYAADPEGYRDRVLAFLRRHLG